MKTQFLNVFAGKNLNKKSVLLYVTLQKGAAVFWLAASGLSQQQQKTT